MNGMQEIFADRTDAGRQLAAALRHYADRSDVVVLALPRGGLPVAYEIARALGAPLDVMIVRKLGTPGQPELAMGAIASGGIRVINQEVVRDLGISASQLDRVTAREEAELERRERAYRVGRPVQQIAGRTVILVDDGIATGSTMLAAVQAVRAQEPARLIVAVPTAARDTAKQIHGQVDELVCLTTPEPFFAIGSFYRDFPQLGDDEVHAILALAGARDRGAATPSTLPR
jgi:predicted phosphoribosyltransferase